MPLTNHQTKRIRTLKRNGWRESQIAKDLHITLGDVKRTLRAPVESDACPEDAAKAVRGLLRAGFDEDVVMANFGDVVTPNRLQTIKLNMQK